MNLTSAYYQIHEGRNLSAGWSAYRYDDLEAAVRDAEALAKSHERPFAVLDEIGQIWFMADEAL
jgi:hypothetical protein